MRSFFSLVASVLVLAGAFAQAAPQSYPLVCRGGGNVTLGYSSTETAALMYFKKGTQPAGAGLQAGMCSWVDRGIGANEPPCLRQTGVAAQVWWFVNGIGGQAYANSTQAPWMRQMTDPTKFQTFQVYNPGNGCFVVTRLGP